MAQAMILLAFVTSTFAIAQWVYGTAPQRASNLPPGVASSSTAPIDPAEEERCKVPDFAKAMGHEEKWKLHNNCK